jgi:hypothetical protein
MLLLLLLNLLVASPILSVELSPLILIRLCMIWKRSMMNPRRMKSKITTKIK